MLKERLIVGLAGLPLCIAIVWFGQPWFTLLVAIWGCLAVFEFYRLASVNKIFPLSTFGILWTLLFILSPYYRSTFTHSALLTSAIFLPLIILLFRKNKEGAFTGWVWTLAGIIYIGWLLTYWILVSSLDSKPLITGMMLGRNWIFLGLFATFASDTTAYFIGRKWGKHPLAPRVSPKKTWEGTSAGLAAAVLVSLLFLLPTPLQLPSAYFSWWQAVLLGLAISGFGQIGDLGKSLFKRNMNAKDSSNFIPGHGGFLDRMDSVAFAGVVVYYYLVWVNVIPLH